MTTKQKQLQDLTYLLTTNLNKNLKKYTKPNTYNSQYKLLITSKIAQEYITLYKQLLRGKEIKIKIKIKKK